MQSWNAQINLIVISPIILTISKFSPARHWYIGSVQWFSLMGFSSPFVVLFDANNNNNNNIDSGKSIKL